jgi:hypothetical protein
MHESLAVTTTECPIEPVAVVFGEVVPCKRLATVFVHTLEDLVGGSVAETGEEGEEAGGNGGRGFVSEDDVVELRCGCYLE